MTFAPMDKPVEIKMPGGSGPFIPDGGWGRSDTTMPRRTETGPVWGQGAPSDPWLGEMQRRSQPSIPTGRSGPFVPPMQGPTTRPPVFNTGEMSMPGRRIGWGGAALPPGQVGRTPRMIPGATPMNRQGNIWDFLRQMQMAGQRVV